MVNTKIWYSGDIMIMMTNTAHFSAFCFNKLDDNSHDDDNDNNNYDDDENTANFSAAAYSH